MDTEGDSEEFHAPSKVSFEESWQFIVKVGLAAHRYGSTAGRLESFLSGLSKKFGYEGVFRSTPSQIVFGLREGPGAPQRLEFVATPAPGVDLDKLARLGDLLNELKAGTLALADSPARLDAIDKMPPPWGNDPAAGWRMVRHALWHAVQHPRVWDDSAFRTSGNLRV